MAEHSPTPWRACKEGKCTCGMIWSLPQDFPVFTARGEERQYVGEAHTHMADEWPDMVYASIPPEQAQANAAFIVEAVNSYASLRAKLALAEKALADIIIRSAEFAPNIAVRDIARAALTAIREGRE